MTVDGQKIVRTEKEVDLQSQETELAAKKPEQKPADAPTLLRPGEQATSTPERATHRRHPTHLPRAQLQPELLLPIHCLTGKWWVCSDLLNARPYGVLNPAPITLVA